MALNDYEWYAFDFHHRNQLSNQKKSLLLKIVSSILDLFKGMPLVYFASLSSSLDASESLIGLLF